MLVYKFYSHLLMAAFVKGCRMQARKSHLMMPISRVESGSRMTAIESLTFDET
jgi:hypothetical protein